MSLNDENSLTLHSAFDAIAVYAAQVTLHELVDFATHRRGYKGGFEDAINVISTSQTLELTVLPDPKNPNEATLFVRTKLCQ